MGYKKDDPCLKKAYADERLFVLMTRDATAPAVVGEWIKQNIGKQPADKLHEALTCAIEMHENQHEMEQRKNFKQKGFKYQPADQSKINLTTLDKISVRALVSLNQNGIHTVGKLVLYSRNIIEHLCGKRVATDIDEFMKQQHLKYQS